MSDQRVIDAAEAICSALHRTDWEHLGDTDAGRTDWFRRGATPKVVRVSIERAILYPMVFVTAEWPNISLPGKVVRGFQRLTVDCGPDANDYQVAIATEQVVVRCLEIFRDVIQGVGVAGRDNALKAGRN